MIVHAGTHSGLRRKGNEDSFLCQPEKGIFAVADGLGGLQFGEVASKMAVDFLGSLAPSAFDDMQMLVRSLSAEIYGKGMELCGSVIGTTLTLAIIADGYLRVAQVGDSVAFMILPDGQGLQLTREQTVAEERRRRGETNVDRYLDHVLTQCLGQKDEVTPDVLTREFPPLSRLLLCSDGITKTVSKDVILETLREGESPEKVVGFLIDSANRNGGPDNSTAVVVFG
ncbi:MAG: protein phosphatase 2C domain-containing protein [Opitutales bacterium]|jgi:protein phosphatase